MNPLLIARNLRTEYLKLLKTAFALRQPELAEAFRSEIEKDGFLTRESFIALAQPFENAPPLDVRSAEARARFGSIAEQPYRHQSDACRRILEGGHLSVITTGPDLRPIPRGTPAPFRPGSPRSSRTARKIG
jgi:ATP-dependent helicase YprA (DUF1998 family)